MRRPGLFLVVGLALAVRAGAAEPRDFNGPYHGRNLDRVAFPIGGMGAGMFCLEGTGAISHMSVRNQMEAFHEPTCFAAICLLNEKGQGAVARVVEGPVPDWKYFGRPGTGNGGTGTTYGLPRFREAEFVARFPFGHVKLSDPALGVSAEIVGWSPFTPPDADPSSLPVGALEYRFTNRTQKPLKAVFSFNSRNFMGKGAIEGIDGGFVLAAEPSGPDSPVGKFAFFVDGRPTTVDHCWFRGGWWDALTLAWRNVTDGKMVANPPARGDTPGASLFVPLELAPGKTETVRLLTCWHVPTSKIKVGNQQGGAAFGTAPSHGTAKKGQQPVSGFLGHGLANTFDPGGDGAVGTLTSPPFVANKKFIHFLVGGGSHVDQTCVNLMLEGKTVKSITGQGTEHLDWATFELTPWAGKSLQIRIVDHHTGPWGHILADHFVLSDEPIGDLLVGVEGKKMPDPKRVVLLEDFEGKTYGAWKAWGPQGPIVAAQGATCDCAGGACEKPASAAPPAPTTYVPWYASQFADVAAVASHWRTNYDTLRQRSEVFSNAFYDTTLPPEVVEAVAANLTILKTPTVLRQHDGRLWCWEGCGDSAGCCAGTCTHVWNYAQAICHLFPAMERSLRETEFIDSQDAKGRQAFRANLPISPGGVAFDASDGQLGGIMKAYREWRISGDDAWLKKLWPQVRQSLDYAIEHFDPRHTGLLEEDHHNTYDINYYGPDGHCGSFYLGALAAAVKMGEALGQDVGLYRELLAKGRRRMESELFNGEFFIQKVAKDGLDKNFKPIDPAGQSEAYRAVAERVNEQGPKYQYGEGCLSDGVLGLWIAAACGLDESIVDPAKVEKHLLAVHRYNLVRDLSAHANPQRPTYAMGNEGGLLLCTWPRGGRLLLPFVYSEEVWTGIEYQVASHLMLAGHPKEGLEIVRVCRQRYDGVRRNPFNEYECGHWYARAMSSYGLIQGLTGLRYDAVTKRLHVDSRVGDFRAFLATSKGFGTVDFKNGKANVEVKWGEIAIKK